jgi:hypothetical protein
MSQQSGVSAHGPSPMYCQTQRQQVLKCFVQMMCYDFWVVTCFASYVHLGLDAWAHRLRPQSAAHCGIAYVNKIAQGFKGADFTIGPWFHLIYSSAQPTGGYGCSVGTVRRP